MLKKIEDILTYWLPPFLWMVLIFYLSSHERAHVSQKELLNFLFFKTLHVLEYAFLNFLIFRALNSVGVEIKTGLKASFVIALLYAATDEIHQTFVPTREGRPRDVFIDLGGITLMYIYIKQNYKFLKEKIL